MQVSRGSWAGLGESERREMPPVDKEAKQAFNFTAMLDRLSTEDKHTPTHTYIFLCWWVGVCVFPVHLSVVECGCVHTYTYSMWMWACPAVHVSECLLYTWQDAANVCEWGLDSKWFLKPCVVGGVVMVIMMLTRRRRWGSPTVAVRVLLTTTTTTVTGCRLSAGVACSIIGLQQKLSMKTKRFRVSTSFLPVN